MKKLFVIILVLLVFTSIKKPSEDSFNDYINSELNSNENNDVLTIMIKGVPKIQSNITTTYYDKIFYSITETTFGNDKHKFLGFVGFGWKYNNTSQSI